MVIVTPGDWRNVGQAVTLDMLEEAIKDSVRQTNCHSLALSGGIDSCLLLHYLSELGEVEAFTMGVSDTHPDVYFARLIVSQYANVKHHVFLPTDDELKSSQKIGDFDGDCNVRYLYSQSSQYVDEIITGDGIDEWTCGYYAHQQDPTGAIYIDYLRRLYTEQLEPLSLNSGGVKIHLPYIAHDVIHLLSQIPLIEKVNDDCRKILIVALARRAGIPSEIIERRKYGLCDAGRVK